MKIIASKLFLNQQVAVFSMGIFFDLMTTVSINPTAAACDAVIS